MFQESNDFLDKEFDNEMNLISVILDEAAARWEENPDLAVICCTEER